MATAMKISGTTVVAATDLFTSIKDKFKELADIRSQIAKIKELYVKQDALVNELLPLFIRKTDKQFIIDREITLGNEVHRLIPYFYDEKKGTFLSKTWKSTAFGTATIE
jgi:succinyl-CoA synthetase beta subunit